jgi:hypothetical protein
MGQGLPLRQRWQYVRCTPESCRPIAPPNLAALGQEPTSSFGGSRIHRINHAMPNSVRQITLSTAKIMVIWRDSNTPMATI